MIDVLSTADIPIQRFDKVEQVKENERVSRLSQNVYGEPDDATENKYVLCIWNDQRHSTDEVVDLITLHLKKQRQFGEMVTKVLDSYGRSRLVISGDLELMFNFKKHLEKSGLIHTIRSTKDYFREEMCDTIIHWIADISQANLNGNYLVVGEIICKALLNNYRVGNSSLAGEFGFPPADTSLIKQVNTSLLGIQIPAAGTFPPQPFTMDQSNYSENILVPAEHVPEHWINDGQTLPSFKVGDASVRVQYLIFFDIRLWKSLRTTLRDLYISVLVSNPNHKLALGHCYAQLYPLIAEMYVLVDREPECSIVNSLSTQLFTTPSVATDISKYKYFSMHMAGLYTFFTKFRIGTVNCVDLNTTIPEYSSALKNRRFGQLFHDFEYILNRNTEKSLVTGNTNRIKQLCDFLMLFQGVLPLVREKNNHVEFESDLWIRYFNCMPSVLQLANTIAGGIYQCNPEQTENAIRAVSSYIYSWVTNTKSTSTEISNDPPKFKVLPFLGTPQCVSVDFTVEDGKVSLHHPIHVFLSYLIQFGKIDSAEELRKLMLPSNGSIHQNEDASLSLLFDFHYRVLVLLSQIKIGIWVRNGMSIRSQMNYYRDITLRDPAYCRDIFMVQVSLVTLNPADTLLRILDRWGLINWNSNATYDLQKRIYMIEDLLHYLIVFITERRQLQGLSVKECKKKYITKEIIQCLAFKPMSFSEICNVVPDLLTTDEMFEIVLAELTTFKPPVGIRENGLYQLKPEYIAQFNTRYLHFSSPKMAEAETVMKTFIHNQTKKPMDQIVIEPCLEPIESGPFVNIGAFTRTDVFIHFIFSVLKFASEELQKEGDVDGILGLVFSLLHTAAIDDLQVNNNIEQTFSYHMCQPLKNVSETEKSSESLTLLLASFARLPIFNPYRSSIIRIIHLIHKKNPEFVTAHFVEHNCQVDLDIGENVGDKSSEKKGKDKKEFAKKKQKKALAMLQKQQKKFAKKNKTFIDEEFEEEENTMDTDTDDWMYPHSQCILCRMPCDSKSIFGILGFVQPSNTHRSVPFETPEWVYEAYGSVQNLDEQEPEVEPEVGSDKWQEYKREINEKNTIGPGFPNSHVKMKTVISSCCHTLHYSCYNNHLTNVLNRGNQLTRNNPDDPNKLECLCPLCRSLNNTFIPIPWKANSRSIVNSMKTDQSYQKFLSYALNSSNFEFGIDKNTVFSPKLRQNFEALFTHASSSFSDDRYAGMLNLAGDNSADEGLNKTLMNLVTSLKLVASNIYNDGNCGLGRMDDFSFATICNSVGATISDLEMSLRGVGYQDKPTTLIVDQIPTISLSLIRVFTEYANTMTGYNFAVKYMGILDQPTESDIVALGGIPIKFSNSPFQDLIGATFLHAPFYGIDLNHFVKSYFIIEIANVLSFLMYEFNKNAEWSTNPLLFELPGVTEASSISIQALSELVSFISQQLNINSQMNAAWRNPKFPSVFYHLLLKSVTPFLRKTAIFFYARCAKDYVPQQLPEFESYVEADRLCDFLNIPHLDSTLVGMCGKGTESQDSTMLVKECMNHIKSWLPSHLSIEYPGIVKLLKLSKRLDEIFLLPILRPTNRDQSIPEPAFCLFCGELIKVQQKPDRAKSDMGYCNLHRESCGRNIGIFLLPKRASILFLNGSQGSFMPAPYLDLHGESEDTMSLGCRRGRPQYLSKARYDHLVKYFWLQHGIPDYIARKLYATLDVGGWDTL